MKRIWRRKSSGESLKGAGEAYEQGGNDYACSRMAEQIRINEGEISLQNGSGRVFYRKSNTQNWKKVRKFFGESNQVRKITFETVAVLRPNASATSTIRTLSCSMLIPSFPNLVITWYNRNIIFSKVKRVTRNKIYSYFL